MPELNNYIITDSSAVILYKTKQHSKGYLVKFFIGFVFVYILMNWIPELLTMISDYGVLELTCKIRGLDPSTIKALPDVPVIVYLFALLFNGLFDLSIAFYTLTFIRNRKVDYKAFVDALPFYFKALLLFIVKTFFVAIGVMLFIVPGIIFALNFSQSFYILADNPNKPIMQILLESKVRMHGNKMNLIKVYISYLPYLLVAYIPSFIIANFTAVNLSSFTGMLLILILDIPLYCAYGYLELGKCTFYELLIHRGFANFKYLGQEAFRENTSNNL